MTERTFTPRKRRLKHGDAIPTGDPSRAKPRTGTDSMSDKVAEKFQRLRDAVDGVEQHQDGPWTLGDVLDRADAFVVQGKAAKDEYDFCGDDDYRDADMMLALAQLLTALRVESLSEALAALTAAAEREQGLREENERLMAEAADWAEGEGDNWRTCYEMATADLLAERQKVTALREEVQHVMDACWLTPSTKAVYQRVLERIDALFPGLTPVPAPPQPKRVHLDHCPAHPDIATCICPPDAPQPTGTTRESTDMTNSGGSVTNQVLPGTIHKESR